MLRVARLHGCGHFIHGAQTASTHVEPTNFLQVGLLYAEGFNVGVAAVGCLFWYFAAHVTDSGHIFIEIRLKVFASTAILN